MKQYKVCCAQLLDKRQWLSVGIAIIVTLCVTLARPAIARAQAITLPSGFRDIEVVYGLTQPTAMDVAPDGRLFIAQKYGSVRVVKNGALLQTPFLNLSGLRTEREWGLIGLALDQNFSQNGFVYVRYTKGSAAANPPTCRHLLSRFTAAGDVAAANSEVILFDMGDCEGTGAHSGGTIHFGIDGKLYTSLGDQQSDPNNAQTLTKLFGKLLRINPDGTIPSDNPFYATASGKNRAIWAYGLRNPYVFAIQPGTGRIYINDVGESTWEEINKGQVGANYGWPTCEGPCSPANPSFVDPIYAYSHNEGCSITGGAFYNPQSAQFPSQYIGKYFFADWCAGWIRTLDPANNNVVNFGDLVALGRPVDLDVGNNGGLYWLSQDPNRTSLQSSVHRIEYSNLPGIARPPRNITAMAGQAVTFTVIASGNGPLTYQWQKNGVNISGATGAAYNFIVAAGDNGAQYRCVVSNSNGSVTSKTATLTVVNNTPPVATITQPGSNTFYHAGDTIHFAGSATDTQDGTLPASAFRWDVVLHHRDHTHDFIPTIEGVTSGSFVIPNSGETDNVVWYRITLTVTDSKGATYSTYRDVKPYVSTLAFVTNPPGLQLSLEGQPQTAPFSVVSVEGMQRMLGAPSPQILNGTAYVFASWSDNGAATHQITTPQNNITYTATFAKDTIFADSFESGDLSKWSAQSIDAGDLSVSSAAAIIGNKGMQAVLDDNTPISVVNETPAGERYYHARFYFNPHSTAMASGDSHVIFFGYSGPGYQTPVVAVELRFSSGSYQVRAALVNDSTVWRYGNWFTIGNAVHFLEVEWQAASTAGANNGALKFWVDNVLRTNITGVDNDTRRIERVRLGAVAGIDPGTHGTEFFDAFESRHTSYIGAAAGGPVIAASASNPDEINAWTEGEQSQNPNFAQQPQSPSLDQHLFLPFSAR